MSGERLITRSLSTGTLNSLQKFYIPPGGLILEIKGGVFALGPESNRLSKLQCIGQAGVPFQDLGGGGTVGSAVG